MPQLGRPYNFRSEATTNVKKVRAGDGVLDGGVVANLSTETRYLKFYDQTEEPNLASAVPFMVIPLPKESVTPLNNITLPFTKTLWHAIVKGAADTDATAGAAGDVRVNLTTN